MSSARFGAPRVEVLHVIFMQPPQHFSMLYT
jgi:hypothetical protein